MSGKEKEAKQKKKGAMPLTLKLKAWWEGYDLEELEKRYLESLPEEEAPKKATKPKKAEPEPEPVDEDLPTDPWNKDLININQYIWGDGFCGPGGPEYIVQLSKLLALSPEMSMFQLGCSIGGPARVLVDKFGVWITGYEESEMLAEKGHDMSIQMGMEKKAAITHYEPEGFEGFDRKFDRGLIKEALFTIQDKKNIIERLEEKLKPGGLVLLTDYVIANESVVGKDSFKEWKVGERRMPYCALSDELEEMFKGVRMQVRVSEDISESYVKMINEAWAGADRVAAKLAKEEDGPRLIQILMREAEFWTRRKQMLESGDLQLWRIVANKKNTGPSGMSDW